MNPAVLPLTALLLAGALQPLAGQAPGTPVGWRYPQCDLNGGGFYQYPSPEPVKKSFELITKWSVPAERALTGDVTGDGALELVAQTAGLVSVYSGQGALISSAAVPVGLRLGALQDADGDGTADILLAGRVKDALQAVFLGGRGGVIRRLNIKARDITPLNKEQVNLFTAEIHGLRDLDGDGREEAVLSLVTGHQLRPRGVLALDAATGAKKWYYPVGPGLTQVLLHDLDRDGLPDALAMGYSLGNGNVAPDNTNDENGFLYSLGGAGRAKWHARLPVYHSGARIAVRDVDRDNTEEVVFSAYVAAQYLKQDMGLLALLNGITGKIEARVESKHSFDDKGLVVTNSVRTGLAEIALGGREGVVRKYDHKLKLLASYNAGPAVSVLAGNDFARSGKPWFFALTDENKLLVLDNALKLVSTFDYPSGGRDAALLVSDLIPGGSNELVLVSDKAYVLTAAFRPEDQFAVSYRFLDDLPSAQLAHLKKHGAAAARLTIQNRTGRDATLRVRHKLRPAVEKFSFMEFFASLFRKLFPGRKGAGEEIFIPALGDKEVALLPEIPARLAASKRITAADYEISVELLHSDDTARPLSSRKAKVRVHPNDRFFPAITDAAGRRLDLLASLVNWVDPHSGEVGDIVARASRLGLEKDPKVKITGSQSPRVFRGLKDERTLEQKDSDYLAQAELAYEAMQKIYRVTYKSDPLALYYQAGTSQKVQFPGETARKSGNCIDNAVLFASILERMELNPLLLLLLEEGHVLVGWTVEHLNADGSKSHKYRFLEPNKFSPEIAFKEALTAGQSRAAGTALKSPPPAGIVFKDGLFTTADGAASLMDVQVIRTLTME